MFQENNKEKEIGKTHIIKRDKDGPQCFKKVTDKKKKQGKRNRPMQDQWEEGM